MENLEVFSIIDIHEFLVLCNDQPKDYINGKFLYNIKGCDKYMEQIEMFNYWQQHIMCL